MVQFERSGSKPTKISSPCLENCIPCRFIDLIRATKLFGFIRVRLHNLSFASPDSYSTHTSCSTPPVFSFFFTQTPKTKFGAQNFSNPTQKLQKCRILPTPPLTPHRWIITLNLQWPSHSILLEDLNYCFTKKKGSFQRYIFTEGLHFLFDCVAEHPRDTMFVMQIGLLSWSSSEFRVTSPGNSFQFDLWNIYISEY